MRVRRCAIIALACLAASVLAGAEDTDAAVIRLEKEWSTAGLKHDVAAVARMLGDDFVGIDGRGVVSDKATELKEAEVVNSAFEFLSETLDEFKFRAYGDAAILTSRNTAEVRSRGSVHVVRFRRTTVWVKRPAGWQCVSFHASRILEPPQP